MKPDTCTTLYLVRHAQSQPSAEIPEPEWPLSATGAEQARALGPLLAALGVRRIYSSPFRRCRETLAPAAAALGLELQLHEGLRERRLSTAWIGDYREVWRRSWEDFSFVLEGGECSWTVRSRMAAAVAEIAARHPGETLALGSHGYAIGLLLHTCEPAFGAAEAGALRTPELVRMTFSAGQLAWDRAFRPGAEFDRIATDFRRTPGIVA
jgi:2,3-bisphosphoglycerate-dependent phosphoglycerate mutase